MTFLLSLLESVNVRQKKLGTLLCRERIGKSESALFLFNMSLNTVIEEIDVTQFSNVEDLLEGKIEISSGKIKVSVNPFEVRCLIMEE